MWPCLAKEPKNSPCSIWFGSIDIACGDRQQKGKLAFSWHVEFCSSGTKGGPSAHCVSQEVGAFFHNQPVLDFSPPPNVEMWQALWVVTWGHPLCPMALNPPTLWAKRTTILIFWHLPKRTAHLSCISSLTEAGCCAVHMGLSLQGQLRDIMVMLL